MHAKRIRIAERRSLPKSIRGTLVSPTKARVEITDVSRAGFFLASEKDVRTSRPLKNGSVIELRFAMPGSKTLCEVTAEVRHTTRKGIGVRAVRMSETARLALERVIVEDTPRA